MIPINEFKGAYCFCIYFVIRSFLKTSYHLIFDLELCVRVKPILKYIDQHIVFKTVCCSIYFNLDF